MDIITFECDKTLTPKMQEFLSYLKYISENKTSAGVYVEPIDDEGEYISFLFEGDINNVKINGEVTEQSKFKKDIPIKLSIKKTPCKSC